MVSAEDPTQEINIEQKAKREEIALRAEELKKQG